MASLAERFGEMTVASPPLERVTCLAIGDPHFKVDSIREGKLMADAVVGVAEARRPTFIVVLGDILHTHERVHVAPLREAYDFLTRLSEVAPLYVLIGNHDMINNSAFLSDLHPFYALKKYPNVTVADVPVQARIGGRTFVFCPYVFPGRFVEALRSGAAAGSESAEGSKKEKGAEGAQNEKEAEGAMDTWKRATAIFAHQEFEGAQMGAVRSEIGDKWEISWPLVVSGHIHDYQELATNLLYVGTPMQHAFGDREDKTISFFEWAQGGAAFSHERIDLRLPKRRIIHLTLEEATRFRPDAIRPGERVKISIEGTPAEVRAASQLPNIAALREIATVVFKTLRAEREVSVPLPGQRARPVFRDAVAAHLEKARPLAQEIFKEISRA